MHKKYASQGLAVITVSLDLPENRKAAEQFLVKQNATFTNLYLDEPEFDTKGRLGFIAPPCQYVLDRQGQWVRFSSDQKDIDPHEVEKLIVSLLHEK